MHSINLVNADEDDENLDLYPDAIDVTESRKDDEKDKDDDKMEKKQEKRTWGYSGWWRRGRRYGNRKYRKIRTYFRRSSYPYYYNGWRKYYRYRKPAVKPSTTPQPVTTTPQPTTTTPQPTTTPKPQCLEGSTVVDECQRSCTCHAGKLKDCYRVRGEFTHIPKEERLRYLQAVQAISTQAQYKGRYEALLALHLEFFRTPIHKAPNFLPWHRWFVLQYENLLREVDCRVTVPYWDWSLVSADPFNSDFWNDTYGFGGNGIAFPPCVRTGPFGILNNWTIPYGGCLQRNFIPTPGVVPNIVAVAQTLAKNLTQFFDFELMLRVNLHDVVHFAIGALMIGEQSAVAPEFFPIHSFVDKIWDEWQAKGNLYRFHESYLAQNFTMPGTSFKSVELLNNEALPECVKVKYAPPGLGNWEGLIEDLKKMAENDPGKLRDLPRMAMAKINVKTFEAFHVSKEERARARRMELDMETKHPVDTTQLEGMEKMIGVKASDIKKMMEKTVRV
ncbi:uncharacterized protein LOC114528537 isoform X2 [Dendronephthya gigantea]|uniref:uncharacterized protein LOC114528537 isoform X2 n=1 Tax=Dendronephthya gigantea TaxID=151771 RepID=UPI00106A2DDA|nr:uncharacterized protein LOC114528537 isoform X2 [Dendronephthya gigantea]